MAKNTAELSSYRVQHEEQARSMRFKVVRPARLSVPKPHNHSALVDPWLPNLSLLVPKRIANASIAVGIDR